MKQVSKKTMANDLATTDDQMDITLPDKIQELHSVRLAQTSDNLSMSEQARQNMSKAIDLMAKDACNDKFGPMTRMKLCMTIMELNAKALESSRELTQRLPIIDAGSGDEEDGIDGDPDSYLVE